LPGEIVVTFGRVSGAKCPALLFAHEAAAFLREHRWVARLARVDCYDLAAAALFITLLALVATTFRDYAISNDEEVQQYYGALIVRYYVSGFTDQVLFHFRDLYLYGGLFDVAAVGLEKIFPLDTYAVRHLFSALIGVGGIGAAWAMPRTIGGPRAGFFAAAAIAVCGIWYGAMFNHTKDIPFAAAMMGALYFLLRLGRELPTPRWHLVLLFGALSGCALGIRVLGLFVVSYAGFIVLAYAPFTGLSDWRRTLAFVSRSALALLPAFLIAYVIMVATWPWAHLALLNPVRAIYAFDHVHYPINTILDGRVYRMAEVPRWYVPTYIAIKLTLVLLIGAGLGLVLAVVPDPAAQITNKLWRIETALVAFAALFPLACDVIINVPGDTGMRHFLFTVPPIAVLAGLGLNGALSRLETLHPFAVSLGVAIVLLALTWNATTLYRLHPDEYLFFNPLVGGLQGASRRYATDYWVNIMPEAVGDLKKYLDQNGQPIGKRPVLHYLVAVCGEQLPFQKAADARLQYTRDLRHADFFIAPTHMNCDRALDGRIVARIERLGVLIGVVKDRRAPVGPTLAHNGGNGSPPSSSVQ
jgi:Dolichyl-phosphate-mannose-protein mannosyltransferase